MTGARARALPALTTAGVIAALFAAASAGADASEGKPPGAAEPAKISVAFHGFRNTDGQALVAVFRTSKGFPDVVKRAAFKKAFAIKGRELRVKFPRVPPGVLALAIHHDEDKDFEMDTGLFGIPTEGYGASRDAPARFGPPEFEDARLALKPGQHLKLRIRVRYF